MAFLHQLTPMASHYFDFDSDFDSGSNWSTTGTGSMMDPCFENIIHGSDEGPFFISEFSLNPFSHLDTPWAFQPYAREGTDSYAMTWGQESVGWDDVSRLFLSLRYLLKDTLSSGCCRQCRPKRWTQSPLKVFVLYPRRQSVKQRCLAQARGRWRFGSGMGSTGG